MRSARPHEVEGDHEQPKERAYPYRDKRQHGQHPRREIPIGGERGKANRKIRADDAWKDEDQPKETEAVKSSDGALRSKLVHRLESGQDVHPEAKQPRDIA